MPAITLPVVVVTTSSLPAAATFAASCRSPVRSSSRRQLTAGNRPIKSLSTSARPAMVYYPLLYRDSPYS